MGATDESLSVSDANLVVESRGRRFPFRRTAALHSMTNALNLRFLAFYLPQFHPTPENDEWWGPGFTEWANVAPAEPKFWRHRQPDLPADLGFYDLRVPEVRAAQAQLARSNGITGFCYYHYWFEGRRLLHRPVDEVLTTSEPDFPFCLCWANEPWTRAWDGKTNEVLIPQTYSAADDVRHLRWLAGVFSDRRYVRVDGKPIFLVYRAGHLPDARRTADRWRREADRLGLGEIYLCSVQTGPAERVDPNDFGFDAAVQFPPFYALGGLGFLGRAARVIARCTPVETVRARHRIFKYRKVLDAHLAVPRPAYKLYPCVTPGFDNSPRRPDRDATIITGSTPELYAHWLRSVMEGFQSYSAEENLVFVNAWNEWAEGNHLEPSLRWGHRYLDAHARLGVSAGSVVGHGE